MNMPAQSLDVKSEVVRLSSEGLTVEAIAFTLGLSPLSVKGFLKKPVTIWTEEEKRTLEKSAGKMSADDIACLVGKTKKQVQAKAQRMGISLAFKYAKPKPWTVSDERFIQRNAGVISGVEIAKQLGRKVEHVYRKAYLMGVSLHVLGENSHAAIYPDHEIELCRQLADEGLKAPTIAKKMEMSRSFVHQVIKHERRTYR
ncbi:TPA: hypothetical protein ACGVAU_004259 [Vibrio vulnificus]|uniref:hypothetical protein n=1 Tax=Vibrio parahaemolyticus TaxID=670 RepID=UPI00226AD18D|nr:hypothetical protein [Vibrio parahaemolyticus]EKO3597256.1 hypothetical protein [Vibrio metschnikovii]EKO3663366.1 hypothetical protein [Vibrio metschnikovii]MCX8758947.1 hypothetical protein [Vibrio parahaemolyticus]